MNNYVVFALVNGNSDARVWAILTDTDDGDVHRTAENIFTDDYSSIECYKIPEDIKIREYEPTINFLYNMAVKYGLDLNEVDPDNLIDVIYKLTSENLIKVNK